MKDRINPKKYSEYVYIHVKTKKIMERIYHPYWLWEDYKYGFYDNISGAEKEAKIKSCFKMFNSYELTQKYMMKVVKEWKYSCEHNLTNESVNQIAYIGQSACSLYDNIPNTVTMECWNKLTKDVQKRSNLLAKKAIDFWKRNKDNQLCLNII